MPAIIERELKIQPNPEIQAKLMAAIQASTAEEFKNELKDFLNLAQFEFSDKKIREIEDIYYDSTDFDLNKIGSGIRIRIENSKRYLTVKKKYGKEEIGERSWLEETREITKQSEICSEKSNFYLEIKKYFPELLGKNIVQQISLRNSRVTYILQRGDEKYELALDKYFYTTPPSVVSKKKFFEIEIEAKSDEAARKLTEFKIEISQGFRTFTYAEGNKYSRGVDLLLSKQLFWKNFTDNLLKLFEGRINSAIQIFLALLGILIGIILTH